MGRKKAKAKPGPYLLRVQLLRERVPAPNHYPFCLPAVRNLETLAFHPKVTFFVGENGAGKSTLLEAVAVMCGLNPEGGSRNFNFATRPSHSALDACLRLAREPGAPADSYFLRAESFFNVATEIERLDRAPAFAPPLINSYGGRSLHEQSHGESFFSLFKNRFGGNGLYLMDEPEAALSPQRQIEFLALLHEFCKRGSQFVIATHSPIIMAYPDAWIYVFGSDGIKEVPYAETEHYRITRGFLMNPQRALAALLDESGSIEEEMTQGQFPRGYRALSRVRVIANRSNTATTTTHAEVPRGPADLPLSGAKSCASPWKWTPHSGHRVAVATIHLRQRAHRTVLAFSSRRRRYSSKFSGSSDINTLHPHRAPAQVCRHLTRVWTRSRY